MSNERSPANPQRRPDRGHRFSPLRVLAWIAGGLAGVAVLLVVGLLVLNTPPGRVLVAGLLARAPLPGGMRLHVRAIQGSIYGRMTLQDVTVTDAKGPFLTAPRVVLDWTPSALLHRQISVQELSAGTVRVLRRPALKPSAPRRNQATLPNISVDLDRLRIGSLWLEPAVTGDRRRLGIDGALTLVRGRTQARLDVRAEPVAGAAAGDRLTLRIDAEPARNRLLLDAHLAAPEGGVVDRLAHLGAPLTADVQGQGTWAAWNGAARASLGGRPLLDADLAARNGRFSARGKAYPDRLVQGPIAALTHPAVDFDLSGTMRDRQLDLAVKLGSPAFDFAADGRLDLARSRFVGLKLHARLEKPEALSDNLSGRDLRMDAALDGAFAHPAADYHLKAAALGVEGRVVHDLDAQGKATPDSRNGWTAEFHATASGVTGAGATVGGLAKRLDIRGTARLDGHRIVMPDLRVSSDHLQARADVDLDFDSGRYAATVKADARQVPIQGLGVVDASANLQVAPAGHGKYRASGHVHGRTDRIDNPAAAKLLGGAAVLDADLARTGDGRIALRNLKLSAPKFRVLDGQAAYGPGDRISASARAVSDAYGPLRLDVSGSLAAPRAVLHADDLRVAGLKGVDLKLEGQGGGAYAVRLDGQSAYGPVSADVGLTLKGGAVQATVRQALFAGIRASGQVRRTPEGPFAGVLSIAGRGLDGTVRLSAAGAVQAADVALTARDASLPLDPPVTVSRGVIRASVKLYPKAPSVDAQADLQGVRRAGLAIDRARLQLAYASGSGTATLTADGERGAPFTLALSARLSPEVIRIDGQGSVDRIPIRLASPATVRRTATGYVLDNTVLTVRNGRIQLSGSYGPGAHAVLRAEGLDLGLTRVFAPGLGLAGRASGSADLTLPAGGAAPTGQLRLQIDGFTRSTAAEVSEPVDLTLAADLTPAAAEAHALVQRRGGAVVGRLQARVALSGAGTWMQRLRAGAVTGGIRYNGPADTLWSLTGLANQTLSGPIAIGADVSGSLDRPRLTGVVRAKDLRYENSDFGTVIDNIAVQARFLDTRLELTLLKGEAGSGSVSATGYADLSAANGYPIDLRVRLAAAQLARSDDLAATVSGDLSITNGPGRKPMVSGDLTLDQGRYQIVHQGKDEIVELTGVRRPGQPLTEVTPSSAQPIAGGLPTGWAIDIHVHAPQQLYVRGMGLDSEWQSDLRITGDLKSPIVVGDVTLVRGVFSFAGHDLTLSRGVIHLNGASPPDPTLDIQASSDVGDVRAMINITGSARAPQIDFSSTPALPADEVLSRLLFGASVGQLSALQAVQLASSLNALRGGGGGLNPLGKLRQVTGFDRLRFYGADKTTGRGPSVGAGRYIAKNLYVELTTDAQGFTATQIELALTNTLHLLSRVGAFGGTHIELRYSRDY